MKKICVFLTLAGLAATVGGCGIFEPTVPSPITGQPVNASQLVAEIGKAERDQAAFAIEAKAKAEAEQRAARSKAEAALADLAARNEITAAQAKAEAAQIARVAAEKIDTSLATFAAGASLRDATARSLADQFDNAGKILADKATQTNGLISALKSIPFVGQALATSGTGGAVDSLIPLLIGGAGMGVLAKRSKAREDAAWDEAEAKAKADAALKASSDQQAALMAALIGRFDTNKDGKLDAAEIAASKGVA
jgi:hypothetical protein